MEIKVLKNVLDRNNDQAEKNKALLRKHDLVMLNMISSPGAGKTTILEKTIPELLKTKNVGVIEGDAYTSKDAERLQKFDIPIVQINTEGTCHLDSSSVRSAFEQLDLAQLDVIFVENVGNLICPTGFDLGENIRIAVLSTTEGDDKPAKYPMLFRQAKAVVLNKVDLIPYIHFDKDGFFSDLHLLNPSVNTFEMSAFKETGVDEWINWLKAHIT
ncbi:MAG: hydrogenase nickel incorporation protein HypB [Bacteroidales bacterium]|nr:hydrogenase nickel incorporation protein HypB [Bacteroidales bacterium]